MKNFFQATTSKLKGLRAHKAQPTPVANKKCNLLVNLFGAYSIKHENIIGVDITPHYIRICRMEISHHKPILKELASVCMEGLFTREDIINHLDTYIESLKSLLEKNNIRTKDAAISLPVSGSIIRTATIPAMSNEELEQASQFGSIWQNLLNLAEPLDEYSTFYQVTGRNPDNTMNILFIGARLADIGLYSEIVKRAGLTPVIADLRCLALNSALHANKKDRTKTDPVAFLEFGPDENYLFILDNNGTFMHEIYVSDEDRHALVQTSETEDTSQIVTQHLANQLKQVLSAHESQYPDSNLKRIYVSSALPLHVHTPSVPPIITAVVNGLSELMEGRHLSECSFCNHIDVPERFTHKVNAEGNLAAWAVTIGLAVHRLDAFAYYQDTKIHHINLMPGNDNRKKAERTKLVSVAAMIALCVIAGLGMAGSSTLLYLKGKSLTNKLATVTGIEAAYNKNSEEVKKLDNVIQQLSTLEQTRKKLPSNQEKLLAAYQHMSNTVPDGVWMKEITFTSPATIELTGNSLDDQNILEFINQLGEGSTFSHVSLKTMQAMSEKSQYNERSILVKRFTLTGTIAGLEPPPPPPPAPAMNTTKPTKATKHGS